ncbi:MAG: toll/interleukin-1 receptor domain-containing protein [Desulfobacterales bacterium]|nr:toll/interleukin-1 receptor domain-containing protein [Desulfobacterales bacterium]
MHEICVCHTPADNKPAQGQNQGWVSELIADIECRIGQMLGRKDNFSVMPVQPEMADSFEKADFLVIVLSGEFLRSQWCDPETGPFVKMVEELIQKGSRVHIVELDNIEYNDRPAVLRNIPGYRFWYPDKERQNQILGYPAKGDPEFLQFYRIINDLCLDISGEITRISSYTAKGIWQEMHPEKTLETAQKTKVFICHADEDSDIAEKLFVDLKKHDIEPWMESKDIRVGANKRVTIRQAIKSASYFIALLSSDSITKGDFNRQQKIALEMVEELSQTDIFIIPVRADDCDPGDIRIDFKDLKTADLFPSYEHGLEKILKAVSIETKSDEKPDTRPMVYLAEVTQDLLMERDELKRYFDQAGYRVLPDKPLYSPDPDAYKTAVCKELAQCRIFIQLLSRLPYRLHSEQPCYSRLQYECAKESGKPVFQWRNPDFNPDKITKDPDHQKLLRADTVMAVNMEDFKREVLQNASKKKSDIPVQDAFVYLNANSSDAELAKNISAFIDKNGLGYAMPPWDSDDEGKESEDDFRDFQEHLEISDGVIVVYGAVKASWARKQLIECRKYMSRKGKSLIVIALYEGPGESKPLNYKLPRMFEIKCRDCLREEEFHPFLRALEQRSAS